MKLAIGLLMGGLGSLTLSAQAIPTPRTVTLAITDDKNPAGTLYNIYRLDTGCPAVPPASLADITTWSKRNATPLTEKTFSEQLAFGKYCYVATATNPTSVESVPSNTASADAVPFAPTISVTVQVAVDVTVNGVRASVK